MSNTYEDLMRQGWVPFGSFLGRDILAFGQERFHYTPDLDIGFFLQGFPTFVLPRKFVSANRAGELMHKMTRKLESRGRVPILYELPLVCDWENVLAEDEKEIRKTELDKCRRATYKLMPEKLKYAVWKAYAYDSTDPRIVKEYTHGQKKWFDDSRWFLGKREGHSPSEEECAKVFFEDGISLEYRIDYALKHPDRMERVCDRLDIRGVNIREPYRNPIQELPLAA